MSDQAMIPAHEAVGALNSQVMLLQTPVEDMDVDTVHTAWSVLDHIEKIVSARKKEMRGRLLEEATELGTKDEKGSTTLLLAGGAIKSEARNRVALKDDEVLALITANGMQPEAGGKFVYKADAKKLEALVASGQLEPGQIPAKITTSYALKVNKPVEVQRLIEGV